MAGFDQSFFYEVVGQAYEPPLLLPVGRANRDTYVFQSGALVVLQQTMFRAVVSIAETAVANDPLSGGTALLEGASRLLGAGHLECGFGGFGGVFGAFRGVVDDVVADELGMRAESLSGDSGVRSRPR